MYKYMRIQGREDSYITKYPKGVFSLCWNLIRDRALTAEEEKLFVSIDAWFKENLPEPEPCKKIAAALHHLVQICGTCQYRKGDPRQMDPQYDPAEHDQQGK